MYLLQILIDMRYNKLQLMHLYEQLALHIISNCVLLSKVLLQITIVLNLCEAHSMHNVTVYKMFITAFNLSHITYSRNSSSSWYSNSMHCVFIHFYQITYILT